MRRLLAAPAVHWLAIGALLFVFAPSAKVARSTGTTAAREPIVITAVELAQIEDLYRRETGAPLTAADESALLEREIRDRLLYREALAHGLLRNDRSIRWRLASKMRFLTASAVDEDANGRHAGEAETEGQEALYDEALALGLDRDDLVVKRILVHKMRLLIRLQADDDVPDEGTLRAFYEAHASDYLQPSRVSFTHVLASRAARQDRAETDARRLLDELRSARDAPAALVSRGDAFPLGHGYRARTRADVAKIFGEAFADEIMAAEPGTWSGPYESVYGWHLVWVDERDAERVAELDSVRSQVLQRYVDERRDAHLEETLARLRNEYEIVIERDHVAADGNAREDA